MRRRPRRLSGIQASRELGTGLREGREGFFAPNIWPRRPQGFSNVFETYYAVMENLATRLMGLMAVALELDEHWFDDKIRDHMGNLQVNYYAALDRPAARDQFRRGEHSDWGSLTILYHDGEPGLQIRSPNGSWEDVPVVAGSFVVNLGDLMANLDQRPLDVDAPSSRGARRRHW